MGCLLCSVISKTKKWTETDRERERERERERARENDTGLKKDRKKNRGVKKLMRENEILREKKDRLSRWRLSLRQRKRQGKRSFRNLISVIMYVCPLHYPSKSGLHINASV